jgi:hypothetical protein
MKPSAPGKLEEESLGDEFELRQILGDLSDELATPLRRTGNPLDYLASPKIATLM